MCSSKNAGLVQSKEVAGEQWVLFHKWPKVGILMPSSAEVCWKLISWNMFGIWLLLGVVWGLGPKTKTQGMINFLASPLKWEQCFFGLFRGKIWNMSKWCLTEKQQRGAFLQWSPFSFPISFSWLCFFNIFMVNMLLSHCMLSISSFLKAWC